MTRWTSILLTILMTTGAVALARQQLPDDRRALAARIAERYDVVPLTDGIALRPKTPNSEVRLIEIADGTVAINGNPVTGRELRDRVGADAESILRLSYLSKEDRRALFDTNASAVQPPDTAVERAQPNPDERTARDTARRMRRGRGDRVRVFGDVTVAEDEAVGGQVVAVFGSVRVDGEVGDQVVAVLGSVDLGPHADVHGEVVSVGGQVRRAPTAQVRGGVTEVSLGDSGLRLHATPWMQDWGPIYLFGGFGAVTWLVGSAFRFLLILLLASIALLLARPTVEASAERLLDNPIKATLVGLAAEILLPPVLLLTAFVLVISVIGIPLLLLLPFVVLTLVLMALIGFTGTAYAVGQRLGRRVWMGRPSPFVDVGFGVFMILLPLLIGRLIALGGWPVTPVAFLLVAAGLSLEFLAWTSGFGAVITNAFSRWQARRAARTIVRPPPPPAPQVP